MVVVVTRNARIDGQDTAAALGHGSYSAAQPAGRAARTEDFGTCGRAPRPDEFDENRRVRLPICPGYCTKLPEVVEAIRGANQETGGSALELGEAEYMVRASGYLKTLDDFRAIPLKTAAGGVPVRLGDVATIQIGPEMRRGVAELNEIGRAHV